MKAAIVVVVVVVVAAAAVLATLAAVGTFSHGGPSKNSASDVTVTGVRLALSAFPGLFSPAFVNFTSGYPMHLSPGATWEVNWSFDNKYGDAGILSVSVNSPFVVDGTVPGLPALFSPAGAGTLSILLRAPDDPGVTLSANVTLVPATPIGSAFTAGNPVSSHSSGAGAGLACTTANIATPAAESVNTVIPGGHYIYTLTVESSTVEMASVLFEVQTSSGAVDTAAIGFYIVNIAGDVVTCSGAVTGAMTSAFSVYTGVANACNDAACSMSTRMSSIYTIIVDMGQVDPTGTGLLFVTLGTNGYAGSEMLALP